MTIRHAAPSCRLSLEPLESRILLAAINPGDLAELTDGDSLYFVQGEAAGGEGNPDPSDAGATRDDVKDAWITIVSFSGDGAVKLWSSDGDPFLLNGDKIGNVEFQGVTENSSLTIRNGVFAGDYGMSDVPDADSPVSPYVTINTDDYGNYLWGEAESPWMNTYYSDGDPVYVMAPEGSGGVVITEDITFDTASTAFSSLLVDGSLKGEITGLGIHETIHDIQFGYINGVEGDTTGGLNLDGNVDRLRVRTTVGELDDSEVNRPGDTDRYGPANIYVKGHLLDFQVSGTIFSDITVLGYSDDEPTFDYDLNVGISGEHYAVNAAAGYINDTPDAAQIVGSPTGDFSIEGHLRSYQSGNQDKADEQDWYVFNAGLGQEITVEMTDGGSIFPAWVFAPSGRLVANVQWDEPTTFVADEPGNYYLMVGQYDDTSRGTGGWEASEDYTVEVTGASPTVLSGIVAGSNTFGAANTGADLEFGDDMSNVDMQVGDSTTLGNLGFVDVRGSGNYADVNGAFAGDVGYITAGASASNDLDAATYMVDGDFVKLETREGDLDIGGFYFPSGISVGGDFAELIVAGDLTDYSYGEYSNGYYDIDIDGAMGAVIVGGTYYATMAVEGRGVDLFHISGDFGGMAWYSRLDTAPGADVRFAYVGGTIYDQGALVPSVSVTDTAVTFPDDGGAIIRLTPISTQAVVGEDEQSTPVPANLTYRYLPIGRTGGFPAGAVMTEVASSDALRIMIESGRADISHVTFGGAETSYLFVSSPDPLAELDLYYVTTSSSAQRIVNQTFHGDIVNLEVAAANQIFAGGHLGLTQRFVTAAGNLPNAVGLAPPSVQYVSAYDAAGMTDTALYFNGVVASGSLGSVRANGSIGDVYVSGDIRQLAADANSSTDGEAYSFRGMQKDARTWDGLAGVVYTSGNIGDLDPGDGLYGGFGGRPVGGIFAGGTIENVVARNAVIEGPIFASNGIERIQARSTPIRDTVIGAGANFSDWVPWDSYRVVTTTIRLENLRLTGAGAELNGSQVQAGVVNMLYIGPGTGGWTDSNVWAGGDATTNEGINNLYVLGGGMDGSGAPPYYGSSWDVDSWQRIGRIVVRGGDMENVSIRALKSIERIDVRGDIIYSGTSEISAPLYIGSIRADNVTGGGTLYVGTGKMGSLITSGDFGANANVNVDGPAQLINIGGSWTGDFTTSGSSGYIGRVIVGNGLTGSLTAGNYIGRITVRSGDVTGAIEAGGSAQNNLAIGRVIVSNGTLASDIIITPNTAMLRPGGGIGKITVRNGDITGNITATSYYDAGKGNPVTADIGLIKVIGGNLTGAVTIQKEDPLDPSDPGGNLGTLQVTGGGLSGAVTVAGNATRILVRGGDITQDITVAGGLPLLYLIGGDLNGDVSVTGDLTKLRVMDGSVSGDISVGGNGKMVYVRNGDLGGSLTVDNLDVLRVLNGKITGTSVNVAGSMKLLQVSNAGGIASDGSIQIGDFTSKAILYGDVDGAMTFGDGEVGDGIGRLLLRGDLNEELAVGGNASRIQLTDGQVTSNGDGGDPRIRVTGNVGLMRVTGTSDALPVIDDEVRVDGSLDFFSVRSGTFDGTLTAGRLGRIMYYTPNGITHAVTSQSNLALLKVIGPIGAPIDIAHHAELIQAQSGTTAAGDITVGSGAAGDGLNRLDVRGNMLGDLTVDGALSRVTVRGNVTGANLSANAASRFLVTGNFTNSGLDVTGALGTASVLGNYADSDIYGNTLGRVLVKGTISGTGEINADAGSFNFLATNTWYTINDAVGVTIDNVHAYVG